MHKELSDKAIEILKNFSEVSKIILYGSVLRGDYNKNSDIDLAIICEDAYSGFPLDMEGIPLGLRQKVDLSLKLLTENSGIFIHAPIYWNHELEEGIVLLPARANPPNMLHNIGLVVYDAYK